MKTGIIFRRLELRLAVVVGFCLLAFSVLAGMYIYSRAYQYQLELADTLQQQLVQTMQAQADIAAFTGNAEIADGVLNGLLSNPTIQGVRIESSDGFRAERSSGKPFDFRAGKTYPLFSPVDRIEPVGSLVVVRNEEEVGAAATEAARFQVMVMLLQVLITTLIIVLVVRLLVIKPITRLALDMQIIRPGGGQRVAVDERNAKDQIGWLSHSANALLDAAETALKEIEAQRNELEKMATHDFLTGLPSMRLAEDRLHVACMSAGRNGKKVALLFIDLDGFKAVNDRFSHEAGDSVLRDVANRLQGAVRREDTAARIGGDEFLVILGNLPDTGAAATVAENIVAALGKPFFLSGHSITLGASVGISVYPEHTGDVKAMRHIADQAMYEVKKSGKGNFAFAAAGSKA